MRGKSPSSAGCLAAFDLLAADPDAGFHVHLTRWQTWVWLSTSGLLGVFLAVPLRKHFIEDEDLPFPDGIAAGETLIMLDSHGPEARKSAFAMVGALVISGFTFLITQLQWVADTIPLSVNAFSARVGLGFGVSLLNIGSGIIIGFRISASMMIGGIIAWIIAPPLLVQHGLIAPDAKRVDILLTTMWPAVGMLIAGGIAGLAIRWRVLIKSFKGLASGGDSGDLALKWVWSGALASATLLVFVQRAFFGTPVWQSVLAIAFALPLGLVALRVLGETNWGPISTMTNLVQAIFAGLAPGDMSASMVSSGITGAVAAESEGLMQDFRAGQMINSTPRLLTYMQLIAVPRRRARISIYVSPSARHLRHLRRSRAAAEPNVAALGWIREDHDADVDGHRRGRRRRGNTFRVDEDVVPLRRGRRNHSHDSRAASGVADLHSVAHGHGHRDADSLQCRDDELHWRRWRQHLEKGFAGNASGVFDSDRVGLDRRRSVGGSGDPAARDDGIDEITDVKLY